MTGTPNPIKRRPRKDDVGYGGVYWDADEGSWRVKLRWLLTRKTEGTHPELGVPVDIYVHSAEVAAGKIRVERQAVVYLFQVTLGVSRYVTENTYQIFAKGEHREVTEAELHGALVIMSRKATADAKAEVRAYLESKKRGRYGSLSNG